MKDKEAIARLIVFMKKYPDMSIRLSGPNQNQLDSILGYLSQQNMRSDRVKVSPVDSLQKVYFEITSLTQNKEKEFRSGNFDAISGILNLRNGQIFRLNKTFFPADSSRLTASALEELKKLRNFLQKNPKLIVEIGGHTNGLPDQSYCEQLSTARAKRVAGFLYQNGIPRKQVCYKGYGKSKPIASNEHPYGRRKNQRVELKIIKIR